MVKIVLKDTYFVQTTPTVLQNKFYTCHKMYYDKYIWIMIDQSLDEFYTRFLFKNDLLPQEIILPLGIAATFINNFIPEVREFLISVGVQVPPRMPTKTNHQRNQSLLLVRNAAVKAEKNIRTIKVVA